MYVALSLVILGGLTFFVLYSPLDLVFQMDSSRTPVFRARIRWLFGLLDRETTREKFRRRSRAGRRFLRERKWGRLIFELVCTSDIVKQTARLLNELRARIRVRHFVVNFEVGLGDPADTGVLFAFLGPLVLFLDSLVGDGRIGLRPNFAAQPVLIGYSVMEVRLRPVQFVSPLVRFILSSSGRSAARALLVNR